MLPASLNEALSKAGKAGAFKSLIVFVWKCLKRTLNILTIDRS